MVQSDATIASQVAGPAGSAQADNYVVVARRYRPQAFGELIGQEHVSQALSNAIATNRVGHAYLFTGARGVGKKTSAARILAKALNCVTGPSATPCNECDICIGVSGGDDVDVLEIDGASNRGIDEIRQLRQNVNVRPSRARFKIYIIDEVHMLTREAFNALLKTLEEPPEHVKFIFCTTEATKIPITILSRCQRFDFAGISSSAIFDRLRQIASTEGVEAEPEALEVIARRAAGSMRDSQSLLEQLLSFSSHKITVQDVHGMLGTAGDERLTALMAHLLSRSAAGALAEIDGAVEAGVDVSQLIEQLFGYFRDCMVTAVGCPPERFLYAAAHSADAVAEAASRLGLNTILAAMQILEHTLSQMRYSTQARVLAELAVVRICQLEDLEALAGLIVELKSAEPRAKMLPSPQPTTGQPAPAPTISSSGPSFQPAAPSAGSAKKKYPADAPAIEPNDDGDYDEPDVPPGLVLNTETAANLWSQTLSKMNGFVVDGARKFLQVEAVGGDRICVSFGPEYALQKAACQRPEAQAKFEQALRDLAGRKIRIDFKLTEAPAPAPNSSTLAAAPASVQKRMQEASEHPMVRRAGELFGASMLSVEEGKE